jgi:hypothetical protein
MKELKGSGIVENERRFNKREAEPDVEVLPE